jgi:N-acetylneuraminate synthase
MIRGLGRTYPESVIGYSDHTLPDESMTSLVTAYLLGARVLEKHFTHDKTLSGNDHYHAMDRHDAKRLFGRLSAIETLLGGCDHKHPLASETPARQYARRSLVATRRLAAGSTLDETCLTYKRPGTRISPQFWDEVMGMRVTRDLESDDIITWGDVSRPVD